MILMFCGVSSEGFISSKDYEKNHEMVGFELRLLLTCRRKIASQSTVKELSRACIHEIGIVYGFSLDLR